MKKIRNILCFFVNILIVKGCTNCDKSSDFTTRNCCKKSISMIPGNINAINYNSYYDLYSKDNDNQIDISETRDSISYITNKEWIKYKTFVKEPTQYKVSYYVSSKMNINIPLEFYLLLDSTDCNNSSEDEQLGYYRNNNFKSNSWTNFLKLESKKNFFLPCGMHSITLCIKKASWIHISKLKFEKVNPDKIKHCSKRNTPLPTDPSPSPTTYTTPIPTQSNTINYDTNCYDYIKFEISDREILLNGNNYHLKGINWFGFETPAYNLGGLLYRSMEDMLDFLKENKFNTIRVPISEYLIYNFDTTKVKNCKSDFNECDISAKEMFMKLFKESAKRGIFLLIDFHNVNPGGWLDPLWYNDKYNEDDFVNAWLKLIDIINDQPNLLGIELFNEPKPPSVWGGGGKYDWRRMAIKLVEAIYYKRPNYKRLIFIEGVNWGKSYGDFEKYPLDFKYLSTDIDNRIVLCPHIYGPSVYDSPLWKETDFPNNMPDDWDKDIGLFENAMMRPSVLTEWGGHYVDKDKQWQDKLSQYLIDNCIEDNFYWCLTPDSNDTGGLLKKDYYTAEEGKLKLLDKVQKYPTIFTQEIKNDNICFINGKHVNPNC